MSTSKRLKDLLSRTVGGWKPLRHLGSGASADVFEAERAGQRAALKIYRDDMLERFGKKRQLLRIERQLQLRDVVHPNLVEVIEGGRCSQTEALYLAMQYLEGSTLDKCLNKIDRHSVPLILSQVASAARYLEDIGITHRDIKPSNIQLVPPRNNAILLDLGVIRPIGLSEMTDRDGRQFLGTLRYSSPEYLYRREQDSLEGWRALTFYQLGAVLHDLLVRRPLFADFSEPWAQLVEAVTSRTPTLEVDDVPAYLKDLARACLVKDPAHRLQLVNWNSFFQKEGDSDWLEQAKQRIKAREVVAASEEGIPGKRERFATALKFLGDRLRMEAIRSGVFPPVEITKERVTDNSGAFDVIFQGKQRYGYAGFLRIRLTMTSENSGTDVRVSGSASRSHSHSDERVAEAPLHELYRGPMEVDLLCPRVTAFMYASLDRVQELAATKADASAFHIVVDIEGIFNG